MSTTSPDHAAAEARFRALLDHAGLPAPDDVAHWHRSVAFYWYETKTVVVVDLDEIDEDLEDFDPRRLEPFGLEPEWREAG